MTIYFSVCINKCCIYLGKFCCLSSCDHLLMQGSHVSSLFFLHVCSKSFPVVKESLNILIF
uniref:Putative ovule protein n=1 Tax=Solanum chacoense TaxID=4108 RepID=A0A0V0GPP8_SOLCH